MSFISIEDIKKIAKIEKKEDKEEYCKKLLNDNILKPNKKTIFHFFQNKWFYLFINFY